MSNPTNIQSFKIKTLFLDISGVLLNNGWDTSSRAEAIKKFGLDKGEVKNRHKTVFNTYEIGRITLDEYTDSVFFYRNISFSKNDFKAFMFQQSQALDGCIGFFKTLKQQHQLKVVALSNEVRELNEYRIKQFKLDELFDAYISSCCAHLCKPNKEMLYMACDISHTAPKHASYIDDTATLIEIGASIGLQTLHFQDLEETKKLIKTCIFYK